MLISAGVFAQNQTPPSDLDFRGADQPKDIVLSEESKHPQIMSAMLSTMMSLPPQVSTFSGSTRGYWFTAPTSFTITELRVPEDASTADQNIEVVKFNSVPPHYSSLTNDFVSLGRWVNVAGSGAITCNITVNSGDIIGVLGDRGTTNSYGEKLHATSINGHPVTLTRLGMQYALSSTPAQNLWQESDYYIGRIEMYYDDATAPFVPISNWAMVLGAVLIGAFIVVRYRRRLA